MLAQDAAVGQRMSESKTARTVFTSNTVNEEFLLTEPELMMARTVERLDKMYVLQSERQSKRDRLEFKT